MSELEGHSTAAFERLCAHYERAQRRQGEQIEALQRQIEQQSAENEALRQRIERLDGLVTGLAQGYETLAETLRELWR
ncbi:MAG: MbeD/MobD family mobilization/exclusion protein [Acidobacteriota bacterium]|nr:MbeD/MobD family mobilization/exclusion protein [Acidobacteriota bacterium]